MYITWKTILKQLKEDLIGKDSYRGVTFTYSYLANQFGHFSLGFIPTLMLFYCFVHFFKMKAESAVQLAGLIIALVWTSFEVYNFLGPLLSGRKWKSKNIYLPGEKYVFQPNWWHVGFDTLVDVLFFSLGASTCAFFISATKMTFPFLDPTNKLLAITCILLLILFYPALYWYKSKMYLQYANFPYQHRLSQWSTINLSDDKKKIILDYIDNNKTGKHLLLLGNSVSGKSELAVAIGTECALKSKQVYYTTITNFLHFLFDNNKIEEHWAWDKSYLIIIDQINTGKPVDIEMIEPYELIKAIVSNANDMKKIVNTNIVWVIGIQKPQSKQNWQNSFIDELKINKENLIVLEL